MLLSRTLTFSPRSLPTARIYARNVNTYGIPIIDFGSSKKQDVANDIVRGFKEMGFVYLGGHGIADSVVNKAFKKVIYPAQIVNKRLTGRVLERRIFQPAL